MTSHNRSDHDTIHNGGTWDPRPGPGPASRVRLPTSGRTTFDPRLSNSTTSSSTQPEPDRELVRLENPRPSILRGTNDYTQTMPLAPPAELGSNLGRVFDDSDRKWSADRTKIASEIGSPVSAKWTLSKSMDLDRAKLHHHHHVTSSSRTGSEQQLTPIRHRPPGLGEIKPLVKLGRDMGPSSGKSPGGHNSTVNVKSKPAVVTEQPLPRRPSLPSTAASMIPPPVQLPLLLPGHARGVSRSAPSSLISSNATIPVSMICQRCGRCRCVACCTPRPLPSCWICGPNSCLCSAETVLDTVTCMGCVRGCLYLTKGAEDETEDENLCACDGPHCASRWACLGAVALCLPCVWCYVPLKTCGKVCAAGYARYRSNGCHCAQSGAASGAQTALAPRGAPPFHKGLPAEKPFR